MTSRFHIGTALLLSTALLLTGCVNREQADAKLSRACAAAVGALLPEGAKIDSVKEFKASASPEGQGYRHLDITAVYLDGWIEQENQYQCIFEEGFGFLNMGYTAAIYQVNTGERIVGKSGNEIMGDAQDFLKLNDAVRGALYEE